jgi:hypothetical protein
VPGIVWLEGIWLVIHEPAWAMPVRLATLGALELAIVVVAVRALLGARAGTDLPERRIARGLEALLPARIARVAAAELVIVGVATRFLFGGWRRAVPAGFTYHRHSGLRMMLGVLPLLAVGDVLLLELVVLPHAGAITKLVVHALSIYGLVWLVGLYATSKARPHRIADDRLTLHRGILGTVELPLGDIEAVSDVPDLYDDWKRRAYLVDALRADLAGDALLELRLARPATFEGILRDRTGTRVIVAVDDPAAFRDAINRRAAGGRDVIG